MYKLSPTRKITPTTYLASSPCHVAQNLSITATLWCWTRLQQARASRLNQQSEVTPPSALLLSKAETSDPLGNQVPDCHCQPNPLKDKNSSLDWELQQPQGWFTKCCPCLEGSDTWQEDGKGEQQWWHLQTHWPWQHNISGTVWHCYKLLFRHTGNEDIGLEKVFYSLETRAELLDWEKISSKLEESLKNNSFKHQVALTFRQYSLYSREDPERKKSIALDLQVCRWPCVEFCTGISPLESCGSPRVSWLILFQLYLCWLRHSCLPQVLSVCVICPAVPPIC